MAATEFMIFLPNGEEIPVHLLIRSQSDGRIKCALALPETARKAVPHLSIKTASDINEENWHQTSVLRGWIDGVAPNEAAFNVDLGEKYGSLVGIFTHFLSSEGNCIAVFELRGSSWKRVK